MSLSASILIVLTVACWGGAILPAVAQPADSPVDGGIEYATRIYMESTGKNSSLFSGYRYKARILHSRDVGHPFYLLNDWTMGSIVHDGLAYQNVNLIYDVVDDRVVLENPYNFLKIELLKDRVTSFSVMGRDFVHLTPNEVSGTSLDPGFYEVLYDGTIKVYARRKKEVQERLESGIVITRYKAVDRYFLYKDGLFTPVMSKASVLDALSDKKSDLKKFLSQSRIRFNKQRETAMSAMVRFYENGTE